MRAYFRNLLETLRDVHSALVRLGNLVGEASHPGPADDNLAARIQKLEMAKEVFEGEMEGRWLKIDARYNASRSAEERTKTRLAQADLTPGDNAESEEAFAERYRAYLQGVDAEGSEEAGLSPVREILVGSEAVRERVKRSKWGG